jgi:hypothetical protein
MLDALLAGNQPTALAISPDGNLTLCQLPSFEEFLAGRGGKVQFITKKFKNKLLKFLFKMRKFI